MPDIREILAENRKRVQRERRKEWRKEHAFDLIHTVLTAVAVIISLIALIVSIIALTLQFKGLDQSPNVKPEYEAAYAKCDNGQD